MGPDLRDTPLYQEAEALFMAARQPGTGRISDANEPAASPDGDRIVFSGTLMDSLEGSATTRICLTHVSSGDTRVMTFGPNTDRASKFSPDGKQIAFLSDRRARGDFQLYFLNPSSGAVSSAASIDGWIEYLHWSPDGKRLLLGVAGHGADVAGAQGAVTSKQADNGLPPWIPTVQTQDEGFRWRRAYIYDLASNAVRQASPNHLNVWEAVWNGNKAILAVTSPGTGEGLWYSAGLRSIDLETGESREIYRPRDQIGLPSGSPSGGHVAVVEGVCSDRGLVAGNLRVIDVVNNIVHEIDTVGVDATHVEWRSDGTLLIAGHRAFERVVALYDLASGKCRDVWSSADISAGGRYIQVSGFGDRGDCALIGENFTLAPEVAVIRDGIYQRITSLEHGFITCLDAVGATEDVVWTAPDGLEIHGYLLKPRGTGPFPVILNVHGGPVWQWRPIWLGRGGVPLVMLLRRGFAIFFPNPRGSTGRGQDFSSRVMGDMNGADTQDYLSGLDALTERGIIDPARIGVTGVSYGGNMTSWLITQDQRFAAAAPVAPHTNNVTQRLMSNIPQFMDLALNDSLANLGGKYYTRSPIMYAHQVKTPTLNVAGAFDRCTPPSEAAQFHAALIDNGVNSVLAIYPEEGHGIRAYPAIIDYSARLVSWLVQHIEGKVAS